jgi:hypothetical protein
MKRLLPAVFGGSSIVALIAAAMVLDDARVAPLLGWPLPVFVSLFPETNPEALFNLSRAAIIATLICDVFAYSFLTYCVLTVHTKLKTETVLPVTKQRV